MLLALVLQLTTPSAPEAQQGEATMPSTAVTAPLPHGLVLPAGARVLFHWTGGEHDHLKIGGAGSPDLDGDGVRDVLVGAMRGAYCFGFGPGFVQAYSGKDGHPLARAKGQTGSSEPDRDAFGDTIAALGDVDGDHVADLIVGGWRHRDYTGHAEVFSGKSGARLCELVPLDQGNFGAAVSDAGDVDGDGRSEFGVCAWGKNGHPWTGIYSGATGKLLREVRASLFGCTGDVDGDGLRDWLVNDNLAPVTTEGGGENPSARVVSSRSGADLVVIDPGKDVGHCWAWTGASDVDHDGFRDWVVACQPRDPDRADDQRPHEWDPKERRLRVRACSGKNGAVLWSLDPAVGEDGRPCRLFGVGDIDGDGCDDVALRDYDEKREPAARVRIHSGKTSSLLAEVCAAYYTFGARLAGLGDLDGDGRGELLIGDFEAQLGARCSGWAGVVSFGTK